VTDVTAPERIPYGSHELQYGLLHRAEGAARGTIVLIHGGFWRWNPDYMNGPARLADALAAEGWDVWRPEYRSVGAGGGWPATLDDLGAAIDHLGGLDAASGPLIAVGHSAGGHLAVWATTREGARVPVRGAVSLGGVLDLRRGEADDLGPGAVIGLLGGGFVQHPERYAAADPAQRIDPRARVRIVHGTADDVVPISQAHAYLAAAHAAGQDAELLPYDGDHGVVIDPDHASYPLVRQAIEELASRE